MKFVKYQHVEKYGNVEVDGIDLGDCFVFPKLDGTNASVWMENGQIKAGSRNRELTLENDNQGFYEYIIDHAGISEFLRMNPNCIVYGEWLVKHTLNTYKDSAWKKFYIFDVVRLIESGEKRYIPYNNYVVLCKKLNLDYVPCICQVKNPTEDFLIMKMKTNDFLIQDGKGAGEGIVIKNYDYVNQYGRTTWAKLVSTDFKDKHKTTSKHPKTEFKSIESDIIDNCLKEDIIEKAYWRIYNSLEGWSSKHIPRFLETVFHDFVKEEVYEIIKKYKNPIIDFKKLRKLCSNRIKEIKPSAF